MTSNISDNIVIDNEEFTLLDHLNDLLPDTTKVSIAVGYFFISGFAEIMNRLDKIENSDKPDHVMRLLISPVTNKKTAEVLLATNESYDIIRDKTSDYNYNEEENKELAKQQLIKTLEYMPQRDEDQNAVKKLIDMIKRGKIQVKVYTKTQLHAKAYLFELDDKRMKHVSIIGSSNFSISGIKEHAELNFRTNESRDADALLTWFEKHWNDPSSQEFTKEMAEVMENSWINPKHTPDDVYNKAVVHEHKELFDDTIHVNYGQIELFDFQKIAVVNAIKKLEKYGGVIIADVVGIGKSYIGSAILRYLVENNYSNPLVICPPHLKEMWKDYLDRFNIHGRVLTRYKIGMKDDILSRHINCDAILIDESHNFRHSNTNSYKALESFMQEKTDESMVIMLTATPISNTVNDLKNQLKLFPIESISNIPVLKSASLDEYFKKTEIDNEVTPEGTEKIQELLKYILIRRTRHQILKKYGKIETRKYLGKSIKIPYIESNGKRNYFPIRELKNPKEYDVDKVYSNSFEIILETIQSLKLARYAPGNYIKPKYLDQNHPEHETYLDLKSTTIPLMGIIRTTLLKRMESSIRAFTTSIERTQNGYKEFKRQLNKGIVPIGKDFQDEIYKKTEYYYDGDDERYDEKMNQIKPQYDINAFNVEEWKADIDEDIKKFATIKGLLADSSQHTNVDDKLRILVELIKGLDSKKILIFSESAITVEYIAEYMKEVLTEYKIAHIDSKQDTRTKTSIINKFDPENNNADIKEDQIDILVSTDVLSEGVNLQISKVVINYDFHWNPVRLIQRVGRIDRIGTKHPIVEIYNFLPTEKIDEELQLKKKVERKIETIKKIIGQDQKILTETEVFNPESISDIYACNDDVLDSESIGILDMVETKSEQDVENIKKDQNKLQKIENLPFGIRSTIGNKRLLIACEAEEIITDQTGKVILERNIREHYEVSDDGIKPIMLSKFLKNMGEYKDIPLKQQDESYNLFVAKAWEKFNRDIKNKSGDIRLLKHQDFHIKRLEKIYRNSPDPIIKELLSFVKRSMFTKYQPYKELIELNRRIDHDRFTNSKIITELHKIYERHKNFKYKKQINKPRILYSMMIE